MDLFDESPKVESADDHWDGMPEFVQNKKVEYAKIIVRVDSEEDLIALSEALGQKLTVKTKSAWFPHRPHRSNIIREWIDDSGES